MNLNLKKPIVFFDLEATGVNVASDRIVEYSFIKINTKNEQSELTGRVNPEMPIPAQASEIHGIYDKDIKNEPAFRDVAPKILKFIKGCDLAGFNSNKYDIPLLAEELLRAGFDFDINDINTIDVQVIFHKMEERTLKAAYKFYCGKELVNAHSASADIMATLEVLQAQLNKYSDLKNDMSFLHDFSKVGTRIDFAGRMIYDENNVPVFNFGKYKGKKVLEVLEKDPSYYSWIMKGDFPLYTKQKLKEIKDSQQLNKLAEKFNQ